MKIFKYGKSLYWRISVTFLLILLLLGLAYVMIITYAANRYYQETTQRLNADVAKKMLMEVQPFKNGEVNKEALDKIMHSMMAVNPSLEVYLLDPAGQILSYVVFDKKVKLKRVDLAPIHDFIQSPKKQYILGDDPRNPGEKTIFSATAVEEEGQLMGYVYMVLVSEQMENISSALLGSYWLKIATRSFLITLIAAFAIGLVLIWILTKNLRVVINTFRQFEHGNLHARIPQERMKGELAALSGTFNKMADTILHNIDELKQVDNLRRELIANVSHDLRNPLAVVHGYIETLMIKNEKLSPQERQRYLQVILDGSEKLKKLVSDLFELSKLEAKQVKLKQEPFMINELMQDAVQHLYLFAEEKKVNIQPHIDKSLPRVYADISLMERVIQNLLNNALQYTPENGKIDVEVKQEDDAVKVNIINTGDGIPEEDIARIFDRYYKIGKENKAIGGTGLGLAIVKKILDLHNINIKVESKPGDFTRFSFAVPSY